MLNFTVPAGFMYLLLCLFALYFWMHLTKRLPQVWRVCAMVFAIAFLFAPVVTKGAHQAVAPAIMAVIVGIVSDDNLLMFSGIIPMLLCMGVMLVGVFMWLLLKGLWHNK
jgi:hypothetical protein